MVFFTSNIPGIGLYLHIPFCRKKCHYCDFTSFPLEAPQAMASYLQDLHREISLRLHHPVDTVYIGGGTPSLCTPHQLQGLLDQVAHFGRLSPTAEITIEINPGTITASDLAAYRTMGINRLSIGVQSMNDFFLKQLGRIHAVADVLALINQARTLGFDNLSCDLICGFPGQTLDQFKQELAALIALQPQHVSLYELTIEPNTVLHAQVKAGQLQPADEDLVAEMLEWGYDSLTAAGYGQYELSNYAQPGMQCRHNLKYWTDQNYLGLGLGAHSYLNNQRYWNVKKNQQYHDLLQAGLLPVVGGEQLAYLHKLGEQLMLGLRLNKGLDLPALSARFGPDWAASWQAIFDAHQAAGLMERSASKVRLTRKGRLLANVVFRSFL